jgi:rubrerythrin
MQRVEDFMQSFLTTQTELQRDWLARSNSFYETFYSEDCPARKYRSFVLNPPEAVESIKSSENSAEVITTGIKFHDRQYRHRYQLRANGATWEIHDREIECGVCNTTGKNKDGTSRCNVCKGVGWIGKNF